MLVSPLGMMTPVTIATLLVCSIACLGLGIDRVLNSVRMRIHHKRWHRRLSPVITIAKTWRLWALLAVIYVVASSVVGWVCVWPLRMEFDKVARRVAYADEYDPVIDMVRLDYGGHLDKIVSERNAVLKRKHLFIIGGWQASASPGIGTVAEFPSCYLWAPWK